MFDEQKRVLMRDRFGITHDKEQEWEFFGGTIEPGETPEQALIREIKEELNIHITDFKPLMSLKHFRDEESYNEVHIFIGPLGTLLKDAKQQEGRGIKLYSYTELKHLKLGRTDKDIASAVEQYMQKI